MRIQPDRLEETFATQVDDNSPSYGERQMADQPPLRPGPDGGRDDAAEILGRASYAGFSPEAGASAIAATNIVLDRGQIREEIRSGCHQRYFRACRARGYETWTVTTFGGSDNRLPVANGITGIVMPSAMHCRRSCQGIHFCSGDGRSDRNHGGSGIEPGLKQTGFPQF